MIPEMTGLEEALHSDCTCGHKGLAMAFHIDKCPFTLVRTAARRFDSIDPIDIIAEVRKRVPFEFDSILLWGPLENVLRGVPAIDPGVEETWEVCMEHKSGVNWHVPADPPEGKCDAFRLLNYPGMTSNATPCRLRVVPTPEAIEEPSEDIHSDWFD